MYFLYTCNYFRRLIFVSTYTPIKNPLPIAHCPLSIVHCPLPIAHCPLPIAHCPLPIAHCPLPTPENERIVIYHKHAPLCYIYIVHKLHNICLVVHSTIVCYFVCYSVTLLHDCRCKKIILHSGWV